MLNTGWMTATDSIKAIIEANRHGSFTVTSAFPITATAFSYDAMGRVGYKFTCTPLNCGETGNYYLQHTYDLAGDLTTIYNGYSTFYYTIGGAERVTEVTDNFEDVLARGPGGGSTPVAYTPNGAISGVLLGNGLTESSVYNNRLQPCRMNVNSGGTVISTCPSLPLPPTAPSGNVQDFSYSYNLGADNGNLTSFAAVGTQNFNRSYTYDNLNRLKTMSAPGDVCSGLTWNVDPWGNRTQQNNGGGTCFQPQLPVNSLNQLTGSPYLYDAAGNLTYDGNHHYTYDAENRVVQVDSGATATYSYDASGDRVEKQMSGADSDYLYDGGQVATRWTNGGGISGVDRSYVYLGGQPLVHYYGSEGSLTAAYMHTDHLGSTRIETASGQSVVQCSDFYPYGELIVCGKSQYMLKEFTGKERDTESGLDNFGARYNASSMGRFMTPDPSNLSVDFWLPQTWNRCAYALNNPLAVVDRNGLWPWYIHNEIIDEAFPGLSKSQLQSLKTASANVDKDQSPAGSYKHGMGNGDAVNNTTTPGDTSDYIHQNEQTAEQVQADWIASGHTGIAPGAMTAFGNALHTVADMTSPAHEGYQLWYGTCDFFGVTAAYHFLSESRISDARRNTAIAAARQTFMNTFGWMALQNATDGLTPKVTHKICYTDENGKQSCQ